MIITNWKKTGKHYYRNKKSNKLLQIGSVGKNKYIVSIQLPKKKMQKIHSGTFYSETNARKEAINYMKLHFQ